MDNKKNEQDGKKNRSSNGVFKHFWKTLKDPRWLWVGLIVAVIVIILLLISEGEFPNVTLSNGVVAFVSAVIGVLLTAFAISVQLKQQSDAEAQNEMNVNIYKQKILVYSEFTENMWTLLDDTEVIDDKLKKLRNICFRKLVFYLNEIQINYICEQIESIDKTNNDTAMRAIGEITHILKNSLNEKESIKSSDLMKLFNAFIKEDETEIKQQEQKDDVSNNKQTNATGDKPITFWHFNVWGDQQIKAFENKNWVLNLIEYGEVWRTNALKQVKPNDVVFLFRRGGYGYIGAFRVVKDKEENSHFNILKPGNDYSKEQIEKYDMYNSLYDGATLSSNLFVQPLAYNYKGIGYVTVRRRTIERFVNDAGTVNTYLDRFRGVLSEDKKNAGNKLNETTEVKIEPENQEFLNHLKG